MWRDAKPHIRNEKLNVGQSAPFFLGLERGVVGFRMSSVTRMTLTAWFCIAADNPADCRTFDECLELRKCCATFGDQALQSCWAKTGFGFGGSASSSGSSPDDPGCTAYSGKYCAGIGSNCSALRTCCAGKAEPARSQCETRYFSARDSGDETQRENACMTARLVECP